VSFSILVILSGILIEVKEKQFENALIPILLTFSGIVIEVNASQPENILLVILVMLSGMLINVFCPIYYNRFKKCNKNKINNVFLDISLELTERKFDDVVADYHSQLPNVLPIIIGIVISAMSRILPHYMEEGLILDRLLVFETADDYTSKAMIAVMQNRYHRSTEALLSSMRMPYIEEEITHYVDCVAILRHSCGICSVHDFNKVLKIVFELLQGGYADDDLKRLVPVLVIDNAENMPEELQIHQLSVTDRIKVNNIEQVQRVVGELDYHIVKNAEKNPDAVKQRLKVAITTAEEIGLSTQNCTKII